MTAGKSPDGAARAATAVVVLASLAILAAGCGLGGGEAHPAPNAPLLPPTGEALGAPSALSPTSTTTSAAAPAEDPAGNGAAATEGAEGSRGNGDRDDEAVASQNGDADAAEGDGDSAGEPAAGELVQLQILVLDALNHDSEAFTQGLEMYDGRLFESTGAPGDRTSSIRELSRTNGEVLRSETVPDDVFAEGITFVDDRLVQLTWQDGVAFVWDPETFSETQRFGYEGQGWGLCFNGRVLVMSDGSAELHYRDPVSFERVGNPVTVTLEGEELPSLNELECVGEKVWANVWQTDLIVEIEPVTGRVTSLVDASRIGRPRPEDSDAVLNGIAYDPATETFLITGKDWAGIYEVRFSEAAPGLEESSDSVPAPDAP